MVVMKQKRTYLQCQFARRTVGLPMLTLDCAAKYAVEGFSESLP
jgi:hypothetical protein